MTKKERVCVIGAGMSGLIAMKELLERGHEVICYEKELREGGVFNFPTGVAYDDMRLTVSQHFMCFTSMPAPPQEKRELWTRKQYAEYLHTFAERFDPFRRVKFDTEVTAIELYQGSQVRISCRHGAADVPIGERSNSSGALRWIGRRAQAGTVSPRRTISS